MIATYRGDTLRFNVTSNYTFAEGDSAIIALANGGNILEKHISFVGGETEFTVEFSADEMKGVTPGKNIFEVQLTLDGKVITQQTTIYVGRDEII